ncbi:hypothetical protein BYT27DRAFT_7211030 [Phlegmacium glaucopus]|nr:hypothetical protein BYT27DRAFT_7211030 [Phlegmacium glaucopus]
MYASGQKPLDSTVHALYADKLEELTISIKDAFANRRQLLWDQTKFEQLLMEWIITCDQPFDEVKPEFIAMMEYSCNLKTFSLPKRDGVHWQVIKLGDEMIEETKDMFTKLEGKISLSLDAWAFK